MRYIREFKSSGVSALIAIFGYGARILLMIVWIKMTTGDEADQVFD
jgi:hypothetical protein